MAKLKKEFYGEEQEGLARFRESETPDFIKMKKLEDGITYLNGEIARL